MKIGSWQARTFSWLAENASKGDNLLLALIFRAAVLQDNPQDRIPRVGNNCIIDRHGRVILKMKTKAGDIKTLVFPVKQWNGIWNTVADTVKLDDAERMDLFEKLRSYIAKDYRALQ